MLEAIENEEGLIQSLSKEMENSILKFASGILSSVPPALFSPPRLRIAVDEVSFLLLLFFCIVFCIIFFFCICCLFVLLALFLLLFFPLLSFKLLLMRFFFCVVFFCKIIVCIVFWIV